MVIGSLQLHHPAVIRLHNTVALYTSTVPPVKMQKVKQWSFNKYRKINHKSPAKTPQPPVTGTGGCRFFIPGDAGYSTPPPLETVTHLPGLSALMELSYIASQYVDGR